MNVSTELKQTKDSKESNESNEENNSNETKESTEKKSTETTDLKELKERISRLSEKLMARGCSPSTGALKEDFNIPIETQRRRWSGGMVGREGNNRDMDWFKTRLGAFRERLDERFDKQGWRKSEKSKESKDSKETEEKSEPEEKIQPKEVKPVRESIRRVSEKLLVRERNPGTDVFQLKFDKNIATRRQCRSEELVTVGHRHSMDSYKTGLNAFRARLNEKVQNQKKRSEEIVGAQRRRSLNLYKTRLNVFREGLNAKVEEQRRRRFERRKDAARKSAQEKLEWVITKDKEGRLGLERKKVVSPSTRQVDAAETETGDDCRRGKRVIPFPPLAFNGVVALKAMPAILPPRLGLASADFSPSRKRRRSSSDSMGSLVEPDNRRVRFTYDDDSKFQRKEKLVAQQGGPGMDVFKERLNATRQRSEMPPSPAPAPARRPKPTPLYTRMRADARSPLLTLTSEDNRRIRKLQELKADFDLERARARWIVHQADVIMEGFSPRLREEIESMGVGPGPTQNLVSNDEDSEDSEDEDA
ncbi:hypothetical protein BZA05DRAFT_465328 [Tricharina praecox]|uniref:uncharacterized protein n=1 Tax=Tricharina praecox TaxID=43433 RepID=UPI00222005BD|nr:uncharacterized protein BZA05DRAFT_465328 [Tricharina praecox]KAI5856129.1 hypothetical protein BZA05DRAFT_465328 [Tricharina praecox]